MRLVWDSRANGKMGPVSLTPIYSALCVSQLEGLFSRLAFSVMLS